MAWLTTRTQPCDAGYGGGGLGGGDGDPAPGEVLGDGALDAGGPAFSAG